MLLKHLNEQRVVKQSPHLNADMRDSNKTSSSCGANHNAQYSVLHGYREETMKLPQPLPCCHLAWACPNGTQRPFA